MRYLVRPVMVEAFKWTGDEHQTENPDWIANAIREKRIIMHSENLTMEIHNNSVLWVEVLTAHLGEYIVLGIGGRIYPVNAEVFELSHDKIDEGPNLTVKELLKKWEDELEELEHESYVGMDDSEISWKGGEIDNLKDCIKELKANIERRR